MAVLNNTSKRLINRPLEQTMGNLYDELETKFAAQDVEAFVQKPGIYFDGSDDYLNLDDVVASVIQTYNTTGALFVEFQPIALAAGVLISLGDTSAAEYIQISTTAAGKITCECKDAGTSAWKFTTTSAELEAGKTYGIMLTHNATAPVLYVNREAVPISYSVTTDKTKFFADTTGIDNGRAMCNSIAAAGNANFLNGILHRLAIFNDCPSAAEAYEICRGGKIPYKYQGASTTQHFDETDFATHANWDVTNDMDDSGGNCTYTWSANQTSTLAQVAADRAAAGKSRKRYLFKYGMTASVAADGDLAMTVADGFADGAQALTLTTGTHYIRFTSKAAAEAAAFTISAVSGTDTQGTYVIDDVSLLQVGAVLELDAAGIGHLQWRDTNNKEIATLVGAVPVCLPVSHKEVYLAKTIAADTDVAGLVPAGYCIDKIIVENNTANAITGGLNIGTATGGQQVVNTEAVGANALVVCTLVDGLFSTSAAQLISITDETSWNSASIDVYFVMEKLL